MAEVNQILNTKLDLTSSPHVHAKLSTPRSMQIVILSLVPSLVSAVWVFGLYQLVVVLVAIVAAAGTEFIIKKMRGKPHTLYDGSAVLTGLLLGLILPPNFSLTFTALGSIVAIALGKEIFGGIGYNIFNPALVGRAFLQAAFPVPMTTWVFPGEQVDAVTSATPLSSIKFDGVASDLSSMFFGNIGGCIGETSSLAILIGGSILLFTRIANWRVPLAMLVGVIVFGGGIWLIDPSAYASPVYHIVGGGFLFGALYMATDWVSSPLTSKGLWIYGLGIALVLILIRVFGGLPEGVMYAILFMNAFVPLINKYTRPKLFGEKK